MDFNLKYLKYKQKYYQKKRLLGGTKKIFQYQDGYNIGTNKYTKWTDYTEQDSSIIDSKPYNDEYFNVGGVQINKHLMQQLGRNHSRLIRIKPNDNLVNLICDIINSNPNILNLDIQNYSKFSSNLSDIIHYYFDVNKINDMPDAHISNYISIYKSIIEHYNSNNKNITKDDISNKISEYELLNDKANKSLENTLKLLI